MKSHLLRRRTGWGIATVLMLSGTAGCADIEWNRPEASRPPAASPYEYRHRPTPAKATPSAKPVEATDDYRDRHPSMWKRKLKATYT